MAKCNDKNCAVCGRRFTPNAPVGKYCSAECAREAKRARDRVGYRRPEASELGTHDTAENIKRCLSCKRGRCPGNCEVVG